MAPAGHGFVADAMLGRLARWLRLAGCDTLYDSRMDDNELVRLARQSGRALLTRDTALAARPRLRAYLVRSEEAGEQLAEVLAAFPEAGRGEPRCPECNTPLTAADRSDVEGLVPTYVWVTQEAYHRCGGCGRVYWRGSHWRGIGAVLAKARQDAI